MKAHYVSRMNILWALREGWITFSEALDLLKKLEE